MKVHIRTPYINEEVELKTGRYGNGSTAIQGFSLNGLPVFKATVAVDELPDKGCVFLKGWSENEGLIEALVEAGIVALTGRFVLTGYCKAVEARILKRL